MNPWDDMIDDGMRHAGLVPTKEEKNGSVVGNALLVTAIAAERDALRVDNEQLRKALEEATKAKASFVVCSQNGIVQNVQLDGKVFIPEEPSVDGPNARDCNVILGKPKHYKDGPKDP